MEYILYVFWKYIYLNAMKVLMQLINNIVQLSLAFHATEPTDYITQYGY